MFFVNCSILWINIIYWQWAAQWFSETEMLTFLGLVGLPHHSAIMCKGETKPLFYQSFSSMIETLCKQVNCCIIKTGSCGSWVLSALLALCTCVCSCPGRKRAALQTLHPVSINTHCCNSPEHSRDEDRVHFLLITIKVIYSVIPKNSSNMILAMFSCTTGSKTLLRHCLYHHLNQL